MGKSSWRVLSLFNRLGTYFLCDRKERVLIRLSKYLRARHPVSRAEQNGHRHRISVAVQRHIPLDIDQALLQPGARWTLETFPCARQPGVNRKQIRGFAELDFIAKAENTVFVGKTAVGKTGLT